MSTKRSPFMERRGLYTVPRRRGPDCTDRLWIFLALGFLIFLMGIIIGSIYYYVQTLTSSTELTEVLPTYINAGVVTITGCLIMVLFWRRWKIMVFICVVFCVGTAFLCGITAILTGTHILQLIESFSACHFYPTTKTCQCYSPYHKTVLHLEYSETDQESYLFKQTSTCDSIENLLPQSLYAVCVIYGLVFIICITSAVLALLALRQERLRNGSYEENSDDIYTVSGGSSSPLSLDRDGNLDIPSSHIPHHPYSTDIHLQTSAAASLHTRDGTDLDRPSAIRRSKSFCSPRAFDEEKFDVDYEDVDSGFSAEELYGKSKLKDHRRRNRRAVTLHNLDTNQLMLILSLQMRYMQETQSKESQNQGQNIPLLKDPGRRRAVTPTPRFSDNSQCALPKQIRSHTPQPYHFKHNSRDFDQDSVEDNSQFSDHSSSQRRQNQINNLNMFNQVIPLSGLRHKNNRMHNYEEIDDLFIPPERGDQLKNTHNIPSEPLHRSIHQNLPQRPVSRGNAQASMLPSHPISRVHAHDSLLPPVPLHRSQSTDETRKLPPTPFQRSVSVDHQNLQTREPEQSRGSAFHIVAKDKPTRHNNSQQSSAVAEQKCTDYYNIAQTIKENFQLKERSGEGYMDMHSVSEQSSESSVPPPYYAPPSYQNHSHSRESSALSTVSSHKSSDGIYSEVIPRQKRFVTQQDEKSVDMQNFFGVPNSNFPILSTGASNNHHKRTPNRHSLKRALDGAVEVDSEQPTSYLDSIV